MGPAHRELQGIGPPLLPRSPKYLFTPLSFGVSILTVMRGVKLYLLMVILLAVGAVLGVTLTSGRLGRPKVEDKPIAPTKADMGLEGIHLTEVKGGKKQWEVKARSAQYFKDRSLAVLTGVEAIIFTKDGRTFSIKGDEAQLSTDTQDIELKGNVVATGSDGSRLTTDHLKYSREGGKISTDARVVMTTPQFRLEGKGLVIDLENEKFYLLEGVQAVR